MANETTAAADQERLKVTIEQDVPESFKPSLSHLQERAENLSRMSERGIVNEVSGASLVARDDGQVNLSSTEYTQYKLNPDGRAVEESLESVTVTNRKKITADEIIVNEHKLNPHLYELTNFKQVLHDPHNAVGNFCIWGTALVKAWEPSLKRYVMIRRQVRIPMFSPAINVPEIPTALKIADPLKEVNNMQVTMASGYQVNGAITDAKSNIGKAGADRPNTTTDNAKKVDGVEKKAENKADEAATKAAETKATDESSKTGGQ